MERVNAVLRHPVFMEALRCIEEQEAGRVFCGHGMEHLIDVARIAWILCLESGAGIDRELVYAAALLHDIGRCRQYEYGTPHELASTGIASEVLPDCGYGEAEVALIIGAIRGHRRETETSAGFNALLYRADKLSRRCFDCPTRDECYWPVQNEELEY